MNPTVEERIRRAAVQLDEAVERRAHGAPGYFADAGGRRRRTSWVAAAAAVVAVAGAAVVVQREGGQRVVQAPPASAPVGGEGWERLPDAPIAPRFQHLLVSTGDGFLVWGGYSGRATLTDGAFYDADAGRWTVVPDAPLARDRGDAVGVWTGTEVVVVNGIDGDVRAAAYRPSSNTWRSLPNPPLANAANAMTRAVLVDGTVVVVAVSEEGEPGVRNQVAVFDTASSQWRIGEVPSTAIGSSFDAVVVGSEVVVVGRRGAGGKSCGATVVAAYRPAEDTWRALDAGPVGTPWVLAVASTGREVAVVSGHCGDQEGERGTFLLDPATGAWRAGAAAPAGVDGDYRYAEVWTGRELVVTDERGTPAFYDPAADAWRTGTPNPLGRSIEEVPWVWVDGRLAVFSGGLTSGPTCCTPIDGGYLYTLA